MRIAIALPVLNEEKVLRRTVLAVRGYVDDALPGHDVTIVIADNGSDDRTEEIGRELASEVEGVRYVRLTRRGKGLAIREAWKSVDADLYAFMDADLATDLSALPELVRSIEGGADLAVGSRFHGESTVRRSPIRKVLSHGYRALLGAALDTDVADVPCGFKAASARLVRDVMPAVCDDQWFFDTELVIRSERAGHRIEEVPVVWRDLRPAGRTSKVRVLPLVKEYVTKVMRLRRALGPRRRTEAAHGVRELLATVTRKEWSVVAALAALAAVATSIPPVVAAVIASTDGIEWTGRQFLSPGDFGIYLSYISQAKAGRFLFENLTTTEPLTPVLNVLWLSVGLLAKAFGLGAIAAYHAARVILIFPFAAVSYASIAYFLRAKEHRLGAFALFMFGSGLGLYMAPLLPATAVAGGAYEWPIDFWVSEANAFLTMLYSPHFIASFGLIVAILTLLLMAFDTGRTRYGLWAGALGLILFEFHPFHVPTLYAVAGVALLVRTGTEGFRAGRWAAYLGFLAISAPSVAYQYWLTHASSNAAFMLDNNITITPSLPFVLAGFGAISFLAVAGWRRNADERILALRHREFLAIWAVVQLLLTYSPLVFQRRLLEGLEFPLVVLSMPALVALYRAIMRRPEFGPTFAMTYGILLASALFLPSSVTALVRSIDAYATNRPPIYYFDADTSSALAWLRDNTSPDAVVLSTAESGNVISGWATRRVYAGHWANTIALDRKQAEIARFFDAAGASARAAFLAEKGISFVYEGPSERRLGTLSGDPSFVPVFRQGEIVVYRPVGP